MGGQDWPKAIKALEDVAIEDKNREGAYICVFGIAMEKGLRTIRRRKRNGGPYSFNTEIWFSTFFWPFFSNYSYEEILKAVLEVLIENKIPSSLNTTIPDEVLEIFGKFCFQNGLINEEGKFHDPYALVEIFSGKELYKEKRSPLKKKKKQVTKKAKKNPKKTTHREKTDAVRVNQPTVAAKKSRKKGKSLPKQKKNN
jgi:hypothetical protein